MPEWQEGYLVVVFLALAYSAALVGVLTGLCVRFLLRLLRRGAPLRAPEAALCAILPLIELAILLVVAALPESPLLLQSGLHHQWHAWMDRLHADQVLHGTLHVANLILVAFCLFSIGRAVYTASQLRAFSLTLRGLASQPATVGGAEVFPFLSNGFHCFTVGVISPRIYISEGLIEQLSARDAVAMVAHESAHVQRRDGLIRAVLTIFYQLCPLPGARLLFTEWAAAAERDCDARAARQVGDPCDVASALVRVAGLAGQRTIPVAVSSFAASDSPADVEGRVHALLTLPKGEKTGVWLPCGIVLSGISALVVLYPYLTHLVELFAHH